jgi:hypothetical protein
MPARRRARVAFFAICCIAVAYLGGAYSLARNLWPIEELRTIKRLVFQPERPTERSTERLTERQTVNNPTHDVFTRLISYPGKVEIPCPKQTKATTVLLLIGQSNSGNHAGQRYESTHGDKVINYFDGKCFIAASPLLGASGANGESWTLLGNKLISSGFADRVVLVSAGIHSSLIRRWAEGGDLNGMLLAVMDEAKSRYRITHVLWHQGESDFSNKTPQGDYVNMFISLVDSLRQNGLSAPIFPSVATKCGIVPAWTLENPIAVAQQSLHGKERQIFQGVNTDLILDSKDRYDDCHFSGTGQDKFANAWVEVLMKAR